MHHKNVCCMKLPMWPERLVGIAAVIATLQLLPVTVSGLEILNTLDGLGVRPKLADLSMNKVGGSSENSVERRAVTDLEGQFIANGQDAYPKEFTHQATLMISTSAGFYSICGAVIISAYHALTAAHCLPYLTGEQNVTMYNHFIGVGVLNLTRGLDNPGSQIAAVLDYRIHPDFDVDKTGFPNDIAMLYVDGPIVENSYVKYAKLAQPGMGNFAKTTCLISGWGLADGGEPTILQWGYQYIPTQEDCEDFWAISRSARITKRQICGYSHPIQICTGDSGGPLVCNDVVVGIVSWGLANCSGCFPGIYTRISVYYWWILKTMSKLSRRNRI